MKLQILITQYKENEQIIEKMLYSIEKQKGIDLKNDIEVIIGNDGSDIKLSNDFLDNFSYNIKYNEYDHSGLPGCRQNLLNDATGEYVMFCDADDEFYLDTGLYTIFSYITKGFDVFTSKFYEEVVHDNDKPIYYPHENDKVYVHGKVFRRQFLLDNQIVWHPELKYHEDICFNFLALIMSNNTIYCDQAFYVWKFRPDSMCRIVCMNNPLYQLETFPETVDSDEALITDLIIHHKIKEAVFMSNESLFKWFFMMQNKDWNKEENAKYKKDAKNRIFNFYKKYNKIINLISDYDKNQKYLFLLKQNKNEYPHLTETTFQKWLKEISNNLINVQEQVEIALLNTDQKYKTIEKLKRSGALNYDGRKIKTIAAYCPRMENGGTERVISILCDLWASSGYNVILLTDDPVTETDYKIPANVKRIIIRKFDKFEYKELKERATILNNIITDNKIDLVIYNAEFSPLVLLDELIIKECGAAFAIYCHSMFFFPLILNHPDFTSLTIPYLLADAVITLNDENKKFWTRFNKNVFSINNPLVEQPDQWEPSLCDSHKILFIGRLSYEKRPFDALKILNIVHKSIPDAELHIVGKSNNGDIEKKLTEIINDCGLQDKIFLHGFHTDVKQFYQSSSVLLLTSKLEGYSLTIQESMLSGIPCVSYDMPYLTLNQYNKGMISVKQGDIQSAANAIIDLFKNDNKRKLLGQLARQSIDNLTNYDISGIWESIFKSIENCNSSYEKSSIIDKKLQILIPQYKETEEIIKPLLMSIESQHRIDFKKNIEVIIGNDGTDVKLSKEFLDSFSFNIKYYNYDHSGPSGCRKNLFDSSDAEYVMFCDADDIFIDNLGLKTIFNYIKDGFDSFVSIFVEEIPDNNKLGEYLYCIRENDKTFVHGKVYRRQFLIDNNIYWHPELKVHEDSCFNVMVQTLSKKNIYCKRPFYLWKWRDNSICRRDPKYILKTYINMIDSTDFLVKDLLKHNKIFDATKFIGFLIYNSYYLLCKNEWTDKQNINYRMITELRLKKFLDEYGNLFNKIPEQDRKKLIKSIKIRNTMEGCSIEPYTFNNWLEHINNLI